MSNRSRQRLIRLWQTTRLISAASLACALFTNAYSSKLSPAARQMAKRDRDRQLCEVVRNNDLQAAGYFLERGADPNDAVEVYVLPGKNGALSCDNYTAMQCAIESDSPEMVRLLFLHGGDPNAHSKGKSALYIAAIHQDTDTIGELIQAGAVEEREPETIRPMPVQYKGDIYKTGTEDLVVEGRFSSASCWR